MKRNTSIQRRQAVLSTLACATAFFCLPAFSAPAQNSATNYPDKAIRLVVPFVVGGGTDILARLFAKTMGQSLGQPMIVENVTGAGGVVGAMQVARAPADGYTLMVGTPGSIEINPATQPDLHYNPERDFIPVSQFSDSPIVLVVNKDTPFNSVQDLIKAAKAKPGSINFGSAGIGSIAHISAGMFDYLAKVKMTHVPYRGTSQAITDLRGGVLQVEFENLPAVLGMIKDKQLRALAMGSAKRSDFLPDLPTIAEAGVPGYDSSSWSGLFAPAKTPPAVIARIERAAMAAARDPEVAGILRKLGAEPVGSSSADFRAYLQRRRPLIEQTVKAIGLVGTH